VPYGLEPVPYGLVALPVVDPVVVGLCVPGAGVVGLP